MKRKKKVRHVVLGTGHSWSFDGSRLNFIKFYSKDGAYLDVPALSTRDIKDYKNIRLVAEVLK